VIETVPGRANPGLIRMAGVDMFTGPCTWIYRSRAPDMDMFTGPCTWIYRRRAPDMDMGDRDS
jgi:hypothetical protein